MKLRQRERLVVDRRDEVGLAQKRLIEPCHGLLLPAQRLHRVADIIAVVVIGRIEFMRPQVVGERFLVPFQAAQRMRAHISVREWFGCS